MKIQQDTENINRKTTQLLRLADKLENSNYNDINDPASDLTQHTNEYIKSLNLFIPETSKTVKKLYETINRPKIEYRSNTLKTTLQYINLMKLQFQKRHIHGDRPFKVYKTQSRGHVGRTRLPVVTMEFNHKRSRKTSRRRRSCKRSRKTSRKTSRRRRSCKRSRKTSRKTSRRRR
jgi:hypothetical protein